MFITKFVNYTYNAHIQILEHHYHIIVFTYRFGSSRIDRSNETAEWETGSSRGHAIIV